MRSDRYVLIAEDDADLAEVLKRRCAELDLAALTCSDGLTALMTAMDRPPMLMILDVSMPAGDGLSVCEKLMRNPQVGPIPVIVMTGHNDPDTMQRCEELGAHYVFKTDRLWDELRPVMIQLLELTTVGQGSSPAIADRTPQLLVVDDDPDISKSIKLRLKQYGVDVLRAFNGMQGYWMALKDKPDAIILDYTMPEGFGNYVISRLKSHSITRDIPIIMLTGRTIGGSKDYSLERELYSLGAQAYFTKPVEFDELMSTLREYMTIPRRPLEPAKI